MLGYSTRLRPPKSIHLWSTCKADAVANWWSCVPKLIPEFRLDSHSVLPTYQMIWIHMGGEKGLENSFGWHALINDECLCQKTDWVSALCSTSTFSTTFLGTKETQAIMGLMLGYIELTIKVHWSQILASLDSIDWQIWLFQTGGRVGDKEKLILNFNYSNQDQFHLSGCRMHYDPTRWSRPHHFTSSSGSWNCWSSKCPELTGKPETVVPEDWPWERPNLHPIQGWEKCWHDAIEPKGNMYIYIVESGKIIQRKGQGIVP